MKAVFLTICNLSLNAAWLILAVMAARLLLRRAPRFISCLLWGLVGLRLVCPFSLQSALSLLPSGKVVPDNIDMAARPQIHSGLKVIDGTVNPVMDRSFTPEMGASINPMQIVLSAACAVWLVGLGVMLFYALASFLLLKRRVMASAEIQGGMVQAADRAEHVPEQGGMARIRYGEAGPREKKSPAAPALSHGGSVRAGIQGRAVRECDEVESPFILGILHPVIYVPSGLDEETLGLVLAHETAHLRRRDHWWKALGFFLLSVYWFQPLCWAAYILLCRDIESACDEKVIKNQGRSYAAAYSQALLDMSAQKRFVSACPLAFGGNRVKARVKGVLHYKKPAVWVIAASVFLCAAVAACFMTSPRQGNPKDAGSISKASVQERKEDKDSGQDGKEQAGNAGSGQDGKELAGDAGSGQDGKEQAGNAGSGQEKMDPAADKSLEVPRPVVDLAALDEIYPAELLYADQDRIVISASYGLFVYSKKRRMITNAVDLAPIGCQAPGALTFSGMGCQKSVSADGGTVYLHPMGEEDMYVYDIGRDSLTRKAYDLEGISLHKKTIPEEEAGTYLPEEIDAWMEEGKTRYTCLYRRNAGGRIGELSWSDDQVQWYPLFSPEGLEGAADLVPEDIQGLACADIWIAGSHIPPELGFENGTAHHLHCEDPDVLEELASLLSGAEKEKGSTGCPFYTALYLTGKDGTVGTVFPATDSCSTYMSGGNCYRIGDGSNEALWHLIGSFPEVRTGQEAGKEAENFGVEYAFQNGAYVTKDGVSYAYRKVLVGRTPNARYDVRYVVLTNDKDISFEKVDRSIYSSNSADWLTDSVIIGMQAIGRSGLT